MLVLNRKVGEKICIDGQIVVTVSRIQGTRVSLAIDAPKEVHVMRGELRPFVVELAPTPPEPKRSIERREPAARREPMSRPTVKAGG